MKMHKVSEFEKKSVWYWMNRHLHKKVRLTLRGKTYCMVVVGAVSSTKKDFFELIVGDSKRKLKYGQISGMHSLEP